MSKLIKLLGIHIIIISIYVYFTIQLTKSINDQKIIKDTYENCCLEHINLYLNSGNEPSFINKIDFEDCKLIIHRLQQNKYTIKGLFYELTYYEIIQKILSIFIVKYIYNYVSYIYLQIGEIFYIFNGLELFLQHYFIILRSVLEAVELIYLEGVSSYLNNTKLIAKNIELIGLLLVYKIIYQLFNFVSLMLNMFYNFSLILLNTTNKVYKLIVYKSYNTNVVYKNRRRSRIIRH
jgi:hypothetical protein